MNPGAEPDVTVVIIVYNDASRLERAVRSALDQTLGNTDVVVVDDASTDATPDIVKRLVAAYPDRVQAVRLPVNSGACGRPRNAGVAVARGRHVMFLDSDDTLDRHACANMLSASERHAADLVIGRCVRHYVERGVDQDWMPWLFKRQAVYTSLSEEPGLLYDVLSTNKMYRREFLSKEGLTFQEGRFYEDNLFSAHAYLVAKKIAVIPHRIYNWNVERRQHGPSVTNRAKDVRNLADRIAIHREIDELLAKYGTPELKVQKDVRFIAHDLRTHLNGLSSLPEEHQRLLVETAAPYLAELSETAFYQAAPLPAIGAYLVRQGDHARAASLYDYATPRGVTPRLTTDLVERDGRIHWCDRDLDDPVGSRVLDVTGLGLHSQPLERLHLDNSVTSVRTDGAWVDITGELTNPLGRIKPDAPLTATLQFSDRRGRRQAFSVPLELRHGGRRIRWRANFDSARTIRPIGFLDAIWSARLKLTAGSETIQIPLFATDERLGELVLPVRPRLSRFAADVLEAYRTDAGTVAFRLAARGGRARAGARVVTKVRSTSFGARVWDRTRDLERAVRDRLTDRATKVAMYHRVLTRLPVRKRTIVFESHMGKQFSDSPKYIYRELRRTGLDYRAVWVYAKSPAGFPKDAKLVRRESWAYFRELARARFWVDNQGFPHDLKKRDGTTYIQTWHGSAFKLMGFDESTVKQAAYGQQQRLQRALDRFDAFLVRSEHDVRTLAKAFRLRAELLPVGYPRNDALAADADGLIAGLRDEIGIPQGRRIALYAPTFRPDEPGTGAQPLVVPFDLNAFAERFGDDMMLLVRPHYLTAFAPPPALRHAVRDVGMVDDITPLLALADVLITDYSSVMFDYSLLDRPMIFHVPDYDDYVGRSRGSYFDLAEHAPGPITRNDEGLFAALAALPALSESYSGHRRRFVERFSEYDNGTAVRQVVERFFVGGGRRG